MYVRRLQLSNFRNYAQLDLELTPGRLLFLGDNAQGKSNLLEAVQLLASGRSARTSSESETIGWHQDESPQPFTRLQAAVERSGGTLQLETIIAAPSRLAGTAARGGKRFRVNGIPRRSVDFVGQLRAVLFTVDDLEIVSGPPATRRQYLDTMLSQSQRTYHAALQRYGRLMQQRNASLRRIKEGQGSLEELSLWDDGFVRDGSLLIAARQSAVAGISEQAREAQRELSNSDETLELSYEPQLGDEWRGLLPPAANIEAVRSLFAAALAGQRRRELAAGVSLVGPHRDDFLVRLNGVAAAPFASRAQIRTIALALRLAEARIFLAEANDPPVILLDDIVSELDERRRASVLAGVSGFEQVWFTATDARSLPQQFLEGCRRFQVSNGSIAGT